MPSDPDVSVSSKRAAAGMKDELQLRMNLCERHRRRDVHVLRAECSRPVMKVKAPLSGSNALIFPNTSERSPETRRCFTMGWRTWPRFTLGRPSVLMFGCVSVEMLRIEESDVEETVVFLFTGRSAGVCTSSPSDLWTKEHFFLMI